MPFKKSHFKTLLQLYGIEAEKEVVSIKQDTLYKIVRKAFLVGRDYDVMHTTVLQQSPSKEEKETEK